MEYILLTHETGWRKPIQVTSIGKNKEGKNIKRCWFSEYDTFEEAIQKISRHHKCKIVIDKQCRIGI